MFLKLLFKYYQLLLLLIVFLSNASAQQGKRYFQKDDFNNFEEGPFSINLTPDGKWVSWSIRKSRNASVYYKAVADKKVNEVPGQYITFSPDSKWLLSKDNSDNLACHALYGKDTCIIIKNALQAIFSQNSNYLISIDREPEDEHGRIGLVIRDLKKSSQKSIPNVTFYASNKKRSFLIFNTYDEGNYTNTVHRLDMNTGKIIPMLTTQDSLSVLSPTEQNDIFCISNLSKDKNRQGIYYFIMYPEKYSLDSVKFNELGIDVSHLDLNYRFSINSEALVISFSFKGSTNESDEGSDDKVFVWHWQDYNIERRIQSHAENANAHLPKEKSWYYNLKTKKGYEIQTQSSWDINSSNDGFYMLIKMPESYPLPFKSPRRDIALIDARSGKKELVASGLCFPRGFDAINVVEFSADSKNVVYYKDKCWWSYSINKKKTINLTQMIEESFEDSNNDMSSLTPPCGLGGWSKDGTEVFAYTKYNIYALRLDGSGAEKLTNGEKDKTTFRLAVINSRTENGANEMQQVDKRRPVILYACNESNGSTGYYILNGTDLHQWQFGDYLYSKSLKKVSGNDAYIFTRQSAGNPPSLWMGAPGKEPQLVVQTNTQLKEMYWTRSVMVNYKSKSGVELQGALFYPANYDPTRKYPMVVNMYERLSQSLHHFVTPDTLLSTYNTFNFTQQGYFVFLPDIAFEINRPGISAAECIIPAVEEVLKLNIVDKNNIGLMGHSWGAYLTTFIISQTDLFKAAIAGAPPTDLVSFSLGFRWMSGSTTELFESGQARFSGPFYEHQDDYILNSSVYQSVHIHTPLLIACGDKDGLVDWHQGIELYNALRRQQKPCIMLHYRDVGHFIFGDYAKRQMQYFNYYLKGADMPEWMLWKER